MSYQHIYFRSPFEGAKTIAEMIARLKDQLVDLEDMQEDGWELENPIVRGETIIYRDEAKAVANAEAQAVANAEAVA